MTRKLIALAFAASVAAGFTAPAIAALTASPAAAAAVADGNGPDMKYRG